MATPPKLTPEQRAAALEKARIARTERAKIREKIANGELSIKDVLKKADDPIIGKMKAKTLIMSIPGCGKLKTQRIMEEAKISENRRVQGLGSRQVEYLLERLG